MKNINLKVLKGEFVERLDPTGSGKTCLVNAILKNYSLILTIKLIEWWMIQ